jgi:hypothetical protein
LRTKIAYLAWIAAGIALGLILAQYLTDRMLISFLHKLPGCF